MKDRPNYKDHETEGLDSRIYAELASNGWRVPQTAREVQAAEDSLAKDSTKLPDRLGGLPDDAPRLPGGLLARYLGQENLGRDSVHGRSVDKERAEPELDR